jgi:hypothetical protein
MSYFILIVLRFYILVIKLIFMFQSSSSETGERMSLQNKKVEKKVC